MKKQVKQVVSILSEFTCECGGVYRRAEHHYENDSSNDEDSALHCERLTFPHKCHKCGKTTMIARSFPHLTYKGHTWILEEAAMNKLHSIRRKMLRIARKS